MHKLLCGSLIVAAWLLPVDTTLAADGFKATVTVSRKVPADALLVSFHLIERTWPETQSQLRAEEIRIREELKKSGVIIESWTGKASVVNSGFNSTTYNYINPGNTTQQQAVDMRRDISLRVIGARDFEAIAAILGRNGIRHSVTFNWSASKSDAAREELAFEAVDAAVKKARALAERVGSKAGNVIDVTITNASVSSTDFATNVMFTAGGSAITRQLPVDPVVEDESGAAVVINVTAAVVLQAAVERP
jgi:hypothetical protein